MTPPTDETMARSPQRSTGNGRSLTMMVMAVALAAAACGSNADDSATDDATEGASSESVGGATSGPTVAASMGDAVEATGETVTSAGAAEGGVDGEAPTQDADNSGGAATTDGVTAADLNRQIIYTATVEIDVDDVATAGTAAVAAVERAGGFVFGQNTTGGAEPRSVFVFKVRPADFDAALAALDGIGELRNQVISADDVTERVVDLESRIQVAELGVERLRTALENTKDLTEFAEIERLLLDRETELEVMRGQIRTLQDQVDLATITLVLTQDRVENNIELTVTTYEEHNGGLSCPGQTDNRVEAGTDLTVCFELLNAGDQALTDLTLVDTVLGIDEKTTLVTVYGSLDDTLQPGQSLIVAYETRAERSISPRTVAGGQPVAVEGEEPAGPRVSETKNSSIHVTPSDEAPGFGDGFTQGKLVVAAIWSAALVTIGFLLPLLVLLPFVAAGGWLLRLRRRRHVGTPVDGTAAVGFMPPPPMPAPVVPNDDASS